MKHLLNAIAEHVPQLAPLAEAVQRDMAEQEAEFERQRAEFEQRREEMRRRSEERRAELLRRP